MQAEHVFIWVSSPSLCPHLPSIYVRKFRIREENELGRNDSTCGTVATALDRYHQVHLTLYASMECKWRTLSVALSACYCNSLCPYFSVIHASQICQVLLWADKEINKIFKIPLLIGPDYMILKTVLIFC